MRVPVDSAHIDLTVLSRTLMRLLRPLQIIERGIATYDVTEMVQRNVGVNVNQI